MVTLSLNVRVPKWTFCATTAMPSFQVVSLAMSEAHSVTILVAMALYPPPPDFSMR